MVRSLWTQCVCTVSFLGAFISPLLATPAKAEAALYELATGDSQLLVDSKNKPAVASPRKLYFWTQDCCIDSKGGDNRGLFLSHG